MDRDGDDAARESRAERHIPGAPGTRVHTMGMGHLPLLILVSVAVSSLFALAFGLGATAPGVGLVLLVLLIGFAALGPKSDGAATAGTRFTVARVALVCLLGALAAVPADDPPAPLLWAAALMGVAAAGLEAADGWLARITASASGFSERLDAMTSALLVLALALLVWRLGLAGAWAAAAGVLGFAETALRARRPSAPRPAWRVWSELAVRAALALAIVPAVPPPGAAALAVLATGVGLGQFAHGVLQRPEAADRQ